MHFFHNPGNSPSKIVKEPNSLFTFFLVEKIISTTNIYVTDECQCNTPLSVIGVFLLSGLYSMNHPFSNEEIQMSEKKVKGGILCRILCLYSTSRKGYISYFGLLHNWFLGQANPPAVNLQKRADCSSLIGWKAAVVARCVRSAPE